ncbi:hypothetical protein A1Q2_04614 [Trichosporon asahii var. asahii CBS 8904]|jgi:hypothetical protein|uniref:Uncharacterized protein n=1 Tax=Trichosporon asahii var. asahii (strain CBS 8904) TaxID=1220162 RepID=K1VK44_TRIAC|nr:hypothetical protein A1Q2_04614 [Trichosporon asahii var. asahii CBS 8904]
MEIFVTLLALPAAVASAGNNSASTESKSYRFPPYFDTRAEGKGHLSCGAWNAASEDPVTDWLSGQYAKDREACCARVSGAWDWRAPDILGCRVGPEQQLLFEQCANTTNCAPYEDTVAHWQNRTKSTLWWPRELSLGKDGKDGGSLCSGFGGYAESCESRNGTVGQWWLKKNSPYAACCGRAKGTLMSDVTSYRFCPVDQDQCVVPYGSDGMYADCLSEWGTYAACSTEFDVMKVRAGAAAVSSTPVMVIFAAATVLFAITA